MASDIAIPKEHAVALRQGVGHLWRHFGTKGYVIGIEKCFFSDGIAQFFLNNGSNPPGVLVNIIDLDGQITVGVIGYESKEALKVIEDEISQQLKGLGWTIPEDAGNIPGIFQYPPQEVAA